MVLPTCPIHCYFSEVEEAAMKNVHSSVSILYFRGQLTKENSFDDYSSADLIEVIAFKGMTSVGELYTFLSLNVIRV